MQEARIFLVAAEASGDAIGADLARALRAEAAGAVTLSGVGGSRMAAEGVASPFDIGALSVLGLLEGVKAYPRVRRLARRTAEEAAAFQPAAAVLIDSWGFNLRVAWALRRRAPGVRLIKYIGPQVWATRPGRARTLAKAVDLLLTIHSFDAPYFERAGLRTVFTGNPALHRGLEHGDGAAFRSRYGIAPGEPVLLLMFGSRPSEVQRLFAPFAEAARLLRAQFPNLRIVSPVAHSVSALVRERAKDTPDILLVDESERMDAYAAAHAAIACSGTATTELALAGVPTVVGYRIDALSYRIAARLLRTPHIALVNVAAGEEVMPELLQHACAPEPLAKAAEPFLENPDLAAGTGARLKAVAQSLKGQMQSPARAAAREILREIGAPLRNAD